LIYCLYAEQLKTSSEYKLSFLKLNKNLDSIGKIDFAERINNVNYLYKIFLSPRNTIIIISDIYYLEFDFEGRIISKSTISLVPLDFIFDSNGNILMVSAFTNTDGIYIYRSYFDGSFARVAKLNSFIAPKKGYRYAISNAKFDNNKNIIFSGYNDTCCGKISDIIKLDTLGNKIWEKKLEGTILDTQIQDDGYLFYYHSNNFGSLTETYKFSKMNLKGDLIYTVDTKIPMIDKIYPNVYGKQNDVNWVGLLNFRFISLDALGKINVNRIYGLGSLKCFQDTMEDLYIADNDKKLVVGKITRESNTPQRYPYSKMVLFWTDKNGKVIEK
jgi:hypothetical protein